MKLITATLFIIASQSLTAEGQSHRGTCPDLSGVFYCPATEGCIRDQDCEQDEKCCDAPGACRDILKICSRADTTGSAIAGSQNGRCSKGFPLRRNGGLVYCGRYNQCPSGHFCDIKGPADGRAFCCSKSTQDQTCTNNPILSWLLVLISNRNAPTQETCDSGTPLRQNGNLVYCGGPNNLCPPGHHCHQSGSPDGRGFCCSGFQTTSLQQPGQGQCASGMPLRRNGAFVYCNSFNRCPNGYYCDTSRPGEGRAICCSGSGSTQQGQCARGSPLTESSGQYVYCGGIRSTNRCPSGYYCDQTGPIDGRPKCCSDNNNSLLSQQTATCNSGIALRRNGNLVYCGGTNLCPTGYHCESGHSDDGQSYCCSGRAPLQPFDSQELDRQCSTGLPLRRNGNVVYCGGTLNACPAGYYCDIGPADGRSFCCSGSGGSSTLIRSSQLNPRCNSGTALLRGNTLVYCGGTNQCPIGSHCETGQSADGRSYCCTGSSQSNQIGAMTYRQFF